MTRAHQRPGVLIVPMIVGTPAALSIHTIHLKPIYTAMVILAVSATFTDWTSVNRCATPDRVRARPLTPASATTVEAETRTSEVDGPVSEHVQPLVG